MASMAPAGKNVVEFCGGAGGSRTGGLAGGRAGMAGRPLPPRRNLRRDGYFSRLGLRQPRRHSGPGPRSCGSCGRHGRHVEHERTVASSSSGRGRCLADANGMGLFTSSSMPTEADRPELERLVGVVEHGMAAWAEAGHAIKLLKDRQLWRLDGHRTWEEWCEDRLGIGPRRALQLEQAAAFGRQLAEMLPKTGSGASHFQLPPSPAPLEPLAGLDTPEERAAAYAEAAQDAGGTPTREHVKRAVAKRKGKTPLAKPRRYRVPGATVRIEFNRKSNGSVLDALAAAIRLAEEEVERLNAGQSEAA